MDDKLVLFRDFYFNKYIESRIYDLTVAGYNIFLMKDKILTNLNSLWSLRNQEFGINNSKIFIKSVIFKQYDKMGEGGFCTVYNSTEDISLVYKVLNTVEKADVGSVHRFKREFDIMQKENGSGYTIKVFNYDLKELVYSMEKASISLENYIETSALTDTEKDEIIIRCAECMKYLHSKGIKYRDFHPGNILRNQSNEWVVTDFWLAKTIDNVMNENMSGTPHKYSSVVYKATTSNLENRYDSIKEMYEDIVSICGRLKYESPDEIIKKILIQHKETKQFDVVQLVSFLNRDTEGVLMWNLVVEFRREMCFPFVSIINISFEVALREIRNILSTMQAGYHNWNKYDSVAYWAIEVINKRKNDNDEISIEAAKIIEYVASSVGRYDIKFASNRLKNNSSIDGHIRSELSYHEGY